MAFPTSPVFFMLFIACQGAGLVPVMTNPAYSALEMKHAIDLTKPKAILTSSVVSPRFLAEKFPAERIFLGDKTSSHNLRTVWSLAPESYSESLKIRESSGTNKVKASDPACIVFSSGTTGLPKGALISHQAILAECALLQGTTGNLPPLGEYEDQVICVPCFHIAGIALFASSAVRGEYAVGMMELTHLL